MSTTVRSITEEITLRQVCRTGDGGRPVHANGDTTIAMVAQRVITGWGHDDRNSPRRVRLLVDCESDFAQFIDYLCVELLNPAIQAGGFSQIRT